MLFCRLLLVLPIGWSGLTILTLAGMLSLIICMMMAWRLTTLILAGQMVVVVSGRRGLLK